MRTSARKFPYRYVFVTALLVGLAAVVHFIRPNVVVENANGQATPAQNNTPAGKAGNDPRKTTTKQAAKTVVIVRDLTKLPLQVAQMREAILEAVQRGDIRELKYAMDLNELKPDFGTIDSANAIASFKKMSADGNGRTVLAQLGNLLNAPCAVIRGGADIENNKLYVWPYLAELPPDQLTSAQEVDLYRLMDYELAVALRKSKKWTWWRLSIGADGVWHSFSRSN